MHGLKHWQWQAAFRPSASSGQTFVISKHIRGQVSPITEPPLSPHGQYPRAASHRGADGRRGALFFRAASRFAARLSVSRRMSSSTKARWHASSPASRCSSSPRHKSGNSCMRMPCLRVRVRSALTEQGIRVRSGAMDSKAKTRDPARSVNPVRRNCIRWFSAFTRMNSFPLRLGPGGGVPREQP